MRIKKNKKILGGRGGGRLFGQREGRGKGMNGPGTALLEWQVTVPATARTGHLPVKTASHGVHAKRE